VSVGNVSYNNTVRGFEIDSASYYNSCIGNMAYRNGEVGISVYRSPAAFLLGNFASENGNISAVKYGIRVWDDLNTLTSNNVRLIANNASDDRGGSATQTYGLSIEGASTVGLVVDGNKMDTNVTGAVTGITGGITRARDNSGFVTQNEGTSSIGAASTSVTISHGLSITPTAEAFTFTPTAGATNAVDPFFVTAITSTQFTVNSRVAPGGAGLSFRWRANAL
jgi:parallel beta-helix repeat protein